MKLEVGKKYRTVDGTVVTVKSRNADPQYPYIVDVKGAYRWYSDAGLLYTSARCHGLNIIEEIKESTMFNKDYKYLCMDADGYNKAFIGKPEIFENVWLSDDDTNLVVGKNFFNLGDDWKESLREIVYNDDGSIYLRKPRHEFKVDDKVLVRGTGESEWKKRHFCKYDSDGLPICFIVGRTSFTTTTTSSWDEIKPYEEE